MRNLRDLRNDKERREFLNDYRNMDNGWYPWIENGDIGRRLWRIDLTECALIVEEEMKTFSYPSEHTEWNAFRWYIVRDWSKPFADSLASKTLELEEIRRVCREGH